MSILAWISIGALVLQFLALCLAFYKVSKMKKEADMTAGEEKEQTKQLKNDLKTVQERMAKLEEKTKDRDIDFVKMQKDMEYLVKTVENINEKIDRLAPATIKDKP